jgi:hypothetical protein
VGEAVIITAGVLLALGADEWREELERARREGVLLEELYSDFVANTAELEVVTRRHARELEAAQSLIHAAEGDSVLSVPLPDVVSNVLFSNWRFDPEMGALESYLVGGDLGLVADPALRSALADWPRRVNEVWQQEARLLEFVDRDARAFVLSESDVLSLIGWDGSGGPLTPAGRIQSPSREIGQLYRAEASEVKRLLGDLRLTNLASIRLLLQRATLQKLRGLSDATARVLDLLEQELGR